MVADGKFQDRACKYTEHSAKEDIYSGLELQAMANPAKSLVPSRELLCKRIKSQSLIVLDPLRRCCSLIGGSKALKEAASGNGQMLNSPIRWPYYDWVWGSRGNRYIGILKDILLTINW